MTRRPMLHRIWLGSSLLLALACTPGAEDHGEPAPYRTTVEGTGGQHILGIPDSYVPDVTDDAASGTPGDGVSTGGDVAADACTPVQTGLQKNCTCGGVPVDACQDL